MARRQLNPRKSGPGRRPQTESVARHTYPRAEHVRDFPGAKIARGAIAKTLTKKC